MAPAPFFILPVRSCRDLVHVRHHARQIAQLLKFIPHDAIGIAAGAFVVALQARKRLRRAEICFAFVERHLHVFARPARPDAVIPTDLTVLHKPLPNSDEQPTAEDMAFLLRQVHQLAPANVVDELARQNEEVLILLSALRGGGLEKWDANFNPSAA